MSLTKQDLLQQLEQIVSEGRNPNTMNIDLVSTHELLGMINNEDKAVPLAVERVLPAITQAVDAAVSQIQKGGRLIYIGAGTSGRLGILDAVECRPTLSVPDDLVIGLIAGGERALTHAVEGAEDDKMAGAEDLRALQLQDNDMVVGIAASGRTPYVIGALEYAGQIGAQTACLVCNPAAPLLDVAQIKIAVTVGPECLTGSTRMKSGTAQKLVLNMLSTATMIKLGKAYENLMVDVNASNQKLVARATRIVMQATHCKQSEAEVALNEANNSAKLAILMLLTNRSAAEAEALLGKADGFLRRAVEQAR